MDNLLNCISFPCNIIHDIKARLGAGIQKQWNRSLWVLSGYLYTSLKHVLSKEIQKEAVGCYSENSFMALSWIMQSQHAVAICELLKFYYVIQQVFIVEVYTRETSKCISCMENEEFCLKAIKIDIDNSTLHRQFWRLSSSVRKRHESKKRAVFAYLFTLSNSY